MVKLTRRSLSVVLSVSAGCVHARQAASIHDDPSTQVQTSSLEDASSDVYRPRSRPASTQPLVEAVWERDLSLVTSLIKRGMNPDARDDHGSTALYYAAALLPSRVDIVETLLSLGADINARGGGGSSPLLEACESGTAEMVECLLRHGANVRLTDDEGETALHALAMSESPDSEEIVRTLVAHGADVNAIDRSGKTPLDYTQPSSSEPPVYGGLRAAIARSLEKYGGKSGPRPITK